MKKHKQPWVIQEHGRLNYNAEESHPKKPEGISLSSGDRWFVQWDCDEKDYRATYIIGAQWFDEKEEQPLLVTTKDGCEHIDFLSMFATCFSSGIEADEFAQIYEVKLERSLIKAPQLQSVLSPLIVMHFLYLVQQILKRDLRRNYVSREENLKKIKGRIAIHRNERANVIPSRLDRFYCHYQEYSVDTPENRLLKKALLFARAMLSNTGKSESLTTIQQELNRCLAAFQNVNDRIEVWEVRGIKTNKLYREYNEAIHLAKLILRRYDYSITNVQATEQYCPPFWIDMALLYEHYVLGLLREAYGSTIEYQAVGHGSVRPDFICRDPQVVMDTKYMPIFEDDEKKVKNYIVRQLAGYARDNKLFPNPPDTPIPCVVIYPVEGAPENPFVGRTLDELTEVEDKHYHGFYRIAVPLPTLT